MTLEANFNTIIQRREKEKLLNQHSKVIWLTGLSCSGKTTIGTGLEKELYKKGYIIQLIDGDVIRIGINKDLDFSVEGRTENIRRIAEISKMFINCGIITINCFISPTIKIRELARDIIGKDDFIEIFINAPLEVCERRDIKGMYKKARCGEIKDFTGITSPYEAPVTPDLEIRTDLLSIDESVQKVLNFIFPVIRY